MSVCLSLCCVGVIICRSVLGSKWATISSALLFTCALPFIGLNPHVNFSYDEAQTRALLSATMFWFGFTLGGHYPITDRMS